jgi:hypothetical protein
MVVKLDGEINETLVEVYGVAGESIENRVKNRVKLSDFEKNFDGLSIGDHEL